MANSVNQITCHKEWRLIKVFIIYAKPSDANRCLFYDICNERSNQPISQIFNEAGQQSHIGPKPDKSGLVLLDNWVGLKRA